MGEELGVTWGMMVRGDLLYEEGKENNCARHARAGGGCRAFLLLVWEIRAGSDSGQP